MSTTVNAEVQFQTVLAIDTITRPANTTQYAAGDVVANTDDSGLTFEGAVKGPKLTGSISGARCVSNANQGTKPDLELWLFRSEPTAVADNAAFAPTDAEMANLLGVVAFPVANWLTGNSGSGATGNTMCQAFPLAIPFRAGIVPITTIYGVLVTRNTYTPVSAEAFRVELLITQD